MDTLTLECDRCGYCCRNLDDAIGDGKGSLFLFPEERRLFSHELIRPLFAVGRKGRSRPRPAKVIAYQINTTVCPYIGEDNSCAIYDRRPIACRAFPLEGKGILLLSRRCRFVERTLAADEAVNRVLAPRENAANKKLADRLFSILDEPLWFFDLNTQRFLPFPAYAIRRQMGFE